MTTAETGPAADDFLDTVEVFAALPPAVRRQLLSAFEPLCVHAGEWLFHEGDAGDALLVVRSGRLEVLVPAPGGPRRARLLGPGAVLGELALLLGGVRTASVRALRETEVLLLRREVFDELLAEVPAFAAAVTRALAQELRRRVPPAEPPAPERGVLTVVGLTPDALVRPLAAGLADELRRYGPAAVVPSPGRGFDEAEVGRRLGALEAAHDAVVLEAPQWGDEAGWARFCVRQADIVLAVVDPQVPPPAHVDRDLAGCQVAFRALPCSDGRPLRRWLEVLDAPAHHLLAPGDAAADDVARLARRVAGRSLGIVLSGGGARGFAHIGVLSTLLSAGYTVDRVGGTSMGALIAGLFATGLEPAEIAQRCRVELADRNPFNDYTVPRYGLIRARKAAAMLERLFGTADMETTRRSLFTVSADLVSGQEVVLRRGRIAEAVGASMCLPGLVAPVVDGERLLVDGGVLNNLPVDVMVGTAEGPVIAVDVVRKEDPTPPGGAAVPVLVETLGRTCVLGSRLKNDSTRSLAALLITSEIAGVGLLEFKQLPRMVEEGRRAAEQALAGDLSALAGVRPAG